MLRKAPAWNTRRHFASLVDRIRASGERLQHGKVEKSEVHDTLDEKVRRCHL